MGLPIRCRIQCEHHGISTYGPNGHDIQCSRFAKMIVDRRALCTLHGNRALRSKAAAKRAAGKGSGDG